ncbi:MAG: hypothetical protein HC850_14980 [Rhodomicrobium sp.]|nr:hypothetical protein [Rhodomicrobium sp.]
MVNETETAIPGSALTPSQVRKLKIAIVIMSVMIVAGFILLIVGIYMQTRKPPESSSAQPALTIPAGVTATLNLPVKKGTEIAEVLTERGRLIVHLRHPGGGEIAIVDLASGQEIQRIRLVAQETP